MKGVWFPHAWDDVPLEVKTISSIGSNDEIVFYVAKRPGNHQQFAKVVVRLSTNLPTYYVENCKGVTSMVNIPPSPPDDLRIWSFIKKGYEGLSIKCNKFLVAKILFAESDNPDCSDSKWMTTKVNYIKFDSARDNTVGIKIKGMLQLKSL